MSRQATETAWPCVSPPPARPLLTWDLQDVAELPGVRAEMRRQTGGIPAEDDPATADLHHQLVLALDEMASNALRHGGGHVRAAVQATDAGFLVEVSDRALEVPPRPAIGRDPSEGGLGLYLIAEMASAHGWYVRDGAKHVWALLPRR